MVTFADMEHDVTSTAHESLISARGICVQYAGVRVLDKVDVDLKRGEILTLIGLNGAGKSTLVKVLLGLLAPHAGSVTRKPNLRIGYTPQRLITDAAMPMTVSRFMALGGHAPTERVREVLDEVGAENVFNHTLVNLSGGELHRVLLARALLRSPDLLVLDEPLAGVDVTSQSELYRLIARLRDYYHCGVLLVSHDLHVVMAATDTVICLNHHVCCTGHPHSVANHPQFVSLFGKQVAEVLGVYTHHHDHNHDIHGEPVPLQDATHVSPSRGSHQDADLEP